MVKSEKIPSLGEEIEGTLIQPELVQTFGVIHDDSYFVAIKLLPSPEDAESEPLVIMVAFDQAPTLMQQIQKAYDDVRALMTAPRS